jgi:undecaprenyl-diphosphatase
MTILHAIILGIVEGLTEFLPISSTAHLDLSRQLLGLAEDEFILSFEIIIQLGAILAVLTLFWAKIWRNLTYYFQTLSLAFLPTALIGFLVYGFIKSLLGNNLVAGLSLLLGGVIIIYLEQFYFKKNPPTLSSVSSTKAWQIGLFQAISMIPGVSRAGATIMSGMSLGLSRQTMVEFSFLLAIPTMLAATGYDFLKNYQSIINGNLTLLASGFISAFISALIVVKLFIKFVQKNDFTAFGIYRIILGLIVVSVFFWS